MNKIFDFLKENYLVVILGTLFFGLFLYYDLAGGRLCDCETTESYKPSQFNRISINRFYHK